MTLDTLTAKPLPRKENTRWLMLTVLLIGQFMALLDVTIVNVAMPSMRSDLNASGSALQLVVAGYTVSYAMLLITGARLGDIYGRRRMYVLGVLLFTASSLVCGLAPDVVTLIVARFVQGAGAALVMPQIMSVIQVRFDGAARARALSAYAAVISLGGVSGMVLGGVLVDADLFGTGWRPVFLVNVPIGLIVAVAAMRLVPADGPRGTRKLDLVGLTLAVPAVFAVVMPLVLGHEQDWPAWTWPVLAVGIVLTVVFVRVQVRTAARGGDPLLDPSVLRAPGVAVGMVALLLALIAYGGFLFAFALHLQSGLDYSPLRAGLTFAAGGVTFGLCGFFWNRLPARWHHLLTPVGFVAAAATYLVVGLAMLDGTSGGVLLFAGLLGWGVALGVAFSPMLTSALVGVPAAKAADASGVLTTTLQLGQVLGVAILGTLFLSITEPGDPRASGQAIMITTAVTAVLVLVGTIAAVALVRVTRALHQA
ncbi:EmrB/QacA subfamily drug resistance transporter [Herbihabitans rhizosphaerae]|uniref:EmrB/QacA subfamily drug resistance transporter n=1 Tax=Herbihabitans rhizosphaerae TaxID=1872711 RepID=A0A4Q7KKD1_9PSEU|nr:MFS transporter [Herbihabitans rhizosphaerae]RZS34715.1 EmrB/QacA subfamily drug resistance transporter [Herbihabitans rhizosphaerae]